MTKSSLVEAAYPARRLREAMPRTSSPRMSLPAAFIVVALLSLGLWWAVWSAFSSLVFD
jgi:hypothetical protein